MTDFVPDPFKNFTPRQNPPKQAQPAARADNPLALLSASEIEARLDAMSVDELKQTVRLSNAALGGVVLSTSREIVEAVKLRLAHFALTAEIKDAIVAIDKYLNRIEGLPVQKETMDVTVNNTINNFGLSDEKLEAMLLRYKRKRELSQQQVIEHNG